MEAGAGGAALGKLKVELQVPDDEDEYFDADGDDDDEVYETLDDSPVCIVPGLYIGSFMAEQNKVKLQKAGISHVLQVAEGMSPSHPTDFKYEHVSVQDMPGEDLAAHFPKAFAFINEAVENQGGCLVHCVAGVSRSATVCIGWLMWKLKIGYDEAFRKVHAVRPWIMPNAGFRKQLQVFEQNGYDTEKWRAWRHSNPEEPYMTVSLRGIAIPGGRAGPSGSAGHGPEDADDGRGVQIGPEGLKAAAKPMFVDEFGLGTSF